MKCSVLLSLFAFAALTSASPLFSRESDEKLDTEYRWSLLHYADGGMRLIDLDPYEESIEPSFNAEVDMAFHLFTRRNPTSFQVITWDHDSLRNSNFIASHPTRFSIHGWGGSPNGRMNRNVRQGYFDHGEYNMISVDWSIGAAPINYIAARNNAPAAAAVVARFIDFLFEHNYIRFEDLQIFGHSLGGQVAGLTGKAVRLGKVQAIFALDPAGPLFSETNPEERVAPTDAVYVEVIHTNLRRLGFSIPIGQADFFPNYGVAMPGCESDPSGNCSHQMAHEYYAESINSQFTAQECSSFADIGNENCIPTGRSGRMGGPNEKIGLSGVFYITTNAEFPFSRG